MRVTGASTYSLANSLRTTLLNTQAKIEKAQVESVTGQAADTAEKLGATVHRYRYLMRQSERLDSISTANSLTVGRLSASQAALDSFASTTQALSAAAHIEGIGAVSSNGMKSYLTQLTSLANTSQQGIHVFAGINTDVTPISDYETSQLAADVEAAFAARFGFGTADPSVSTVSAADMKDFLQNDALSLFTGAGWSGLSRATDEGIKSRILPTEIAETSVGTNENAFRLAFAAAGLGATFLDLNVDEGVGDAIRSFVHETAANATAETTLLQGQVGRMEERLQNAQDRLSQQSSLMQEFADDMVAVDPYEAATRLNNLIQQLETSYTLTGRVQSLSLLRYI
ncbi:flagellar hook-associated family protein [Notoacmeibacter sp. MSK16QG-6]|uniref:flagellar hook-associated family protein n=1 Tax=Notoacmeibacter sp. MSK16QG-6 TaxID=2957982 RepID=UPI00209DC429|nr:flagellar hook-associated family protein [Notoacmeibacter sp. MSK16QG-6]MCP1200937.1 flagellar hook-associated family protein [Notoacmeibacter sp. MSK16QG-6]